MTLPPNDSEIDEINSAFDRVNQLGSASERLFSRLYRNLGSAGGEKPRTDRLIGGTAQLKQTLHARDQEVARLHGILAALDQGIIMQDTEGRLVLVNEMARKLLGSIKQFWQSDLGMLFREHRDVTTLPTELSPLGEPREVQIGGRVIGAQLAAVADETGARLGTLIVLRDVTREALAERLKDHFVTAISHELRTPMAVIKGVSEMIAAGGAPSQRLLETLSRNVDILDRMIVELLDISEISAENFSLRRDPLEVEALLWNVVNGARPEIVRAGLDVSVLVRDAAALRVRGDDQRLRWAFGHLLQNGIRYTESGGHVIIMARAADDEALTVQFVDTGVGIAQKDLPHIFDRFYRGEARTAGGKLIDPRGLGQGLYIAKRVTEAHGGSLSASSPGLGSIFTVALPRA